MKKQRTVVMAMEPMINEEGQLLNKNREVIDHSKKSRKDDEVGMEEVMYYLLHWGLTYEILLDKEVRYPVSYTVGICQHIKSGVIKMFIPAELTVIGKEYV